MSTALKSKAERLTVTVTNPSGETVPHAAATFSNEVGWEELVFTDESGEATVRIPPDVESLSVHIEHPRYEAITKNTDNTDFVDEERQLRAQFSEPQFKDWCKHLNYDAELRRLYDEHDINQRYDKPRTYGTTESYYGEGDYPPDWIERREAILEAQDWECARCRRHESEVDAIHVDHLTALSDGGTNHLSNLVALCCDCHTLKHPRVDELDGFWDYAPQFPHPAAPDPVAVARQPAKGRDDEVSFPVPRNTPWEAEPRAFDSWLIRNVPPDVARLGGYDQTLVTEWIRSALDVDITDRITVIDTSLYALAALLTGALVSLAIVSVLPTDLAMTVAPYAVSLAAFASLLWVGHTVRGDY